MTSQSISEINCEHLDIKSAAIYLNIPVATIYRYTSQRIIPFYKAGKRIYFKKSEVDDWIFSRRFASKKELEAEAAGRYA